MLEFLHGNPGVLAGLGLGSMAAAVLLRPVVWRVAGVFEGALRQRVVRFVLLACSVSFAVVFVLAVTMFLSRALGG